MRQYLLTACLVLAAVAVVAGCQSDHQVDENKPAPAPNYKMTPAQGSNQ